MYMELYSEQKFPLMYISERLYPVDHGDFTEAEPMVSTADSSRTNGHLVWFSARAIYSKSYELSSNPALSMSLLNFSS